MATANGRRTTTAKKAEVVDFDLRRKKRKGDAKPFRAFGREWPLKKANITALVDFEESEDLAAMFRFVVGHIDKSAREEFIDAIREDDSMDIESLLDLATLVQEAAYPDIPTNPS